MTQQRHNSTRETEKHIRAVQTYVAHFIVFLNDQTSKHDASKLIGIEKEAFDTLAPRLKTLTYGSEEYKASLKAIKPAIDHHYAHNSHHPEHYPNGISGMTLMDIVEMFCDWKAASDRHSDGNFATSIEHNRERFQIAEQLTQIFRNTQQKLGW